MSSSCCAAKLDLFGRELLAVDGTRIKAVNNKDRNFTKNSLEKFIKAVDERLDEYLKRLDEDDAKEAGTGGSRTKNLAEKIEALRTKRDRYNAMLTDLERSGEEQISLTDPDSRAMAAYTKVGVGYNIQIAVDAKNKMIVEQAVSNQVVDMGLLTQTAEAARDILEVEKIDVVADKGYFKIEDIEACEKAGMTPYVPKAAARSRRSRGLFPQGRVPLRRRAGRLHLSGGTGSCDALRKQAAGPEKVRLFQPGRVSGLRHEIALHQGISQGLAFGERGGAGPHGGAV